MNVLDVISLTPGGDLVGWAASLIGNFNYLGPFLVLLLCGMGLPIPEEVTLIGCGLLVHSSPESVVFEEIVAVCAAAILLGDSIPYLVGRHYGDKALRLSWVRWILHPERMLRLRRRFAEHGNWVIFSLRFLPGIRVGGYFTVGMMGVRYPRFILLDTLGVLISVPLSIYLGEIFAGQVEVLEERLGPLSLLLAFILLSILIILGARSRSQRRARLEELKEERIRRQEAASGPTEGLPEE
jgi:membrane protein DedA with SNARE-associated domain